MLARLKLSRHGTLRRIDAVHARSVHILDVDHSPRLRLLGRDLRGERMRGELLGSAPILVALPVLTEPEDAQRQLRVGRGTANAPARKELTVGMLLEKLGEIGGLRLVGASVLADRRVAAHALQEPHLAESLRLCRQVANVVLEDASHAEGLEKGRWLLGGNGIVLVCARL